MNWDREFLVYREKNVTGFLWEHALLVAPNTSIRLSLTVVCKAILCDTSNTWYVSKENHVQVLFVTADFSFFFYKLGYTGPYISP